RLRLAECADFERNTGVGVHATAESPTEFRYLKPIGVRGSGRDRVVVLGGSRRLVIARDALGHPIYYRSPGPIPRNEWDLISCGPNGRFEDGAGDDIVVG